MKTLATVLASFFTALSFSQIPNSGINPSNEGEVSVASKTPFFSYSHGTFAIGSAYGIHPNLRNDFPVSYFFGEGDHYFSIKGIPLHGSFRLSDEKYRSGQPGYFRINFDALAYRQQQLSQLQSKLELQAKLMASCQDSIYLLEGKLSYWNLKKQELAAGKITFSVPQPGIDTLAAPDPSLKFPDINLPDLPDLAVPDITIPAMPDLPMTSMDSIDLNLASLSETLNLKQEQLTKLKEQDLNLKNNFQQLANKKGHSFLSGIRRADLGMSTLSQSALSNNSVPMQGVHVTGTVRRTFYDVAAGFTLPNQLFSNQAFDQVVVNSGNLFNVNDFFAVNSVRLVSSAIIGYGEQGKNSISVETFYSGKSWEQLSKHLDGNQQLASNVSFALTPKRIPTLTWTGTAGQSFSAPGDSLPSKFTDKLALASGVNWKIMKLKGELKLGFRKLGDHYDGWSQGIYLRGAEHREASYRQTVTSRLSVQVRGAMDMFHGSDSLRSIRTTRQVGGEIRCKLFRNVTVLGSYTLLQLDSDTLSRAQTLSHLSRVGLYNSRVIGKWSLTSSFDGGYAQISGIDSNQTLIQLTGHSTASWKKWEFGVKVSYMDFSGLKKLDGSSWMVQPEFGYSGPQFGMGLNYQYQKSDQFGVNGGFQFNFRFKFSELFALTVTAQRWLPTDYTFFMKQDAAIVDPLYMRGKLTFTIL